MKIKKFKRRVGTIYYMCRDGLCDGAIFGKKKQLAPLSVIHMHCTMPTGRKRAKYFITGDFNSGFITCLPLKTMDTWLTEGDISKFYPS